MKRSLTRTGTLRAVTAVVALYALVLHAFLGGLLPLPSVLHGGALCLGQTDGGSPDSDTGGAVHHQPCCTVPGLFAKAEDPVLAAAAIVWPPRSATRIAWRSEVRVAARGPPGSIAHPRGPPTL